MPDPDSGSAPDPAGARLFARYAHAPNALGYCGPAAASALQKVACGAPDAPGPAHVQRLATQFSGAWPYQQLIGDLSGRDPLGEEVGRAYWTGSRLTTEVDAAELGRRLLERFAPQAAHYWAHLSDDLLTELAPNHIFHVLGVYPWTRLLATGAPEPLSVLDGCRIRAGRVVEVSDRLQVEVDRLGYDGQLHLTEPAVESVDYLTPDGSFVDAPAVGEVVAVHWGFACDRLSPTDAECLTAQTDRQIEVTNRRLSQM